MKVAIVSAYPPSKGTLNEYAYYFVEHLSQKEEVEEIILITDKLPEGESYSAPNDFCKFTFEDCWEFNSFNTLSNIKNAIKRTKPDVVFYNLQFLSFGDNKVAATLGLISPSSTKSMGIPSVVLLHNIVETVDFDSAGITNNPIMKWVYKTSGTMITKLILAADMVAVTIPKYVDILTTKYKKDNISLIPHGSFELPPMPDLKLPDGPMQVMSFGKFGTYKKVEVMIEAVELVRKRTDLDIEIVIAGSDNPNVKGYLDSVAEKYSDVSQLRFTGYVAEEDVPVIFGESAVCVFPYTSTTGSSGVLHQAGSYGKAAILPNIGDLKVLIEEEGYRGAYFEPEDVDSLADAIEQVLSDEAYRNDLAKKNYAAAASLPMSDIVDWYLIHFERLMGD